MKNIILLISVMVLSACATTSTVKSEAGDSGSVLGDIIFTEGLLHLIGW